MARPKRPFGGSKHVRTAAQKNREIVDYFSRLYWCDKVNSTYKKHIRAIPRESFAVERPHLKPLPAWIPEPYRLHQRTVDVQGYVPVNTVRYSVPVAWIGRRVEVRETRDKLVVTHERAVTPLQQRITLPTARARRELVSTRSGSAAS